MFNKKINDKLDNIDKKLEKYEISELAYVFGNKKEIIKRNLLGGIFRGIGIGIGISLISAIIVYILRKLIMLNIPVLGEYITDIVEIVQKKI